MKKRYSTLFVQKALQAFGNLARGARLGGWVGDDERATKISCVHGATPGVWHNSAVALGSNCPRLWLHGEY